MKYAVFGLVLFHLHFVLADTELGRPVMFERTLLQANKKQLQHSCHDLEKLNTKIETASKKSDVNTDYFHATINCDYTCKGETPKQVKIKKEFRPLELSLTYGDGSSSDKILWRSLGITLKIWSQEICIAEASKKCTTTNNISELSINKISSGNWQWDSKLDCQQQKTVYSPFDPQFILENKGKTQYHPFAEHDFSLAISAENSRQKVNKLTEFIPEHISSQKLRLLINDKNCKKPIKVHTCFGDCIWEGQTKSGQWSETLSTKEPLGTDDFTVCADVFVNTIKSREYSQQIRKLKCEKYLWEVMRKTEIMGSSCAALRVESSCDSLF